MLCRCEALKWQPVRLKLSFPRSPKKDLVYKPLEGLLHCGVCTAPEVGWPMRHAVLSLQSKICLCRQLAYITGKNARTDARTRQHDARLCPPRPPDASTVRRTRCTGAVSGRYDLRVIRNLCVWWTRRIVNVSTRHEICVVQTDVLEILRLDDALHSVRLTRTYVR